MKVANIEKRKEQTQEMYIYKEDLTKFLKTRPKRTGGIETFTFTKKPRMNKDSYPLFCY